MPRRRHCQIRPPSRLRYIEIDFAHNELYASGAIDENGNLVGSPVLKQGDGVYRAQEIKYNFETKKGKITHVITEEGEGYIHGEQIKKLEDNTTFKLLSISSYDNGMKNNTSQIKQVFEAFAQADQHPVYYHCYGGADRTGVVGFMLGALLGMSYTDLVIDLIEGRVTLRLDEMRMASGFAEEPS